MKPSATYLAVIILSLLCLSACSHTCRRLSVDEARYWESLGYQTRITLYQVNDNMKAGPFLIYTHHAQAQVQVGKDKWKFASNRTLSDNPEYWPIAGGYDYWATNDWYALLIEDGNYN